MEKQGKGPPTSLGAQWEAPRVVLERIVMRRGSLRGMGLGCGRSTMFIWRQLRQNKGFNLVTIGKVLVRMGVPARFFYEQVLDLSEQYDAVWVLEHFRENGDLPRDPFLAELVPSLHRLLENSPAPGRRRLDAEIEALEEAQHFDRGKAKAGLEKLARDLLPTAESAAAGEPGVERGQLADCGHLLLVWGALQQARGHRDDSVEAHVLSHRLALVGGDSKVLGKFFCSAASLLADLGQPAAGLRFAEQARRLFQRRRDRGLLAQALVRICLLLNDLGRYEESRAEALAGLRLAGRQAWRTRASTWLQLGNLALGRGKLRPALAMIRWARKYSRSGSDLEAAIWWREGLVLGRLGCSREAGPALLRAMRTFGKRGQPLDEARVAVDLVEMSIKAGRAGEARKLAQASTPLFEQLRKPAEAPALWLDLLALILQGSWELSLEQTARLRESLGV